MRSVYHVALAVACPVAPERPAARRPRAAKWFSQKILPTPFPGVRDEFRPVYLFPFGDNAASLERRG